MNMNRSMYEYPLIERLVVFQVSQRNLDYHRISSVIRERAPSRWLYKIPRPLTSTLKINEVKRSEISTQRKRGRKGRSRCDDVPSRSQSQPGNRNSSRRTQAKAKMRKDASIETLLVKREIEVVSDEMELWPFHATIFFGDLNYRVEIPRLEVRNFTNISNIIYHITILSYHINYHHFSNIFKA